MFIVKYVAEFTKKRFWKMVKWTFQVIVRVGWLSVSYKSWGYDDGGCCVGWMLMLLFWHVVSCLTSSFFQDYYFAVSIAKLNDSETTYVILFFGAAGTHVKYAWDDVVAMMWCHGEWWERGERRRSGFVIGNIQKGHFELDSLNFAWHDRTRRNARHFHHQKFNQCMHG